MAKKAEKEHPSLDLVLHEQAKPKASSTVHGYQWKIGTSLPPIGAHSIAKHDIYDEYVDRYIYTLTKNHAQTALRLTIVDGFCGGGRYMFGGRAVEGSPLRLLRSVDAARAKLIAAGRTTFNLDVDFIFIDDKADHIEFLREELVRGGYGHLIGTKIHLVNRVFEQAAADVIAAIKKKGRAHHSLFFLDQYGWNGVRLQTVKAVMEQLVNPEVVLTFMVDSLANLLDSRESTVRALAKLDFNREDVKALVAMKDMEGWKRIIQNTLYQHIKAHTGAEFYTTFFVHPPESHRDYWLLHLSKHHQAREEIGNVFWRTSNTMEHHGRDGIDALGFDPKVDVRHDMNQYGFDGCAKERSKAALANQLPPMLHDARKTGAPITKRSLFAEKANDTPINGEILDTQIAAMRDAGDIIVLGKRRNGAGEVVTTVRESVAAFAWNDEIVFPRQHQLFSPFTKAA